MKKSVSPLPLAKKEESVKLTFPQALNQVIDGKKITKSEWNNSDFFILLREGKLELHKPDGKFYDLIISEGDLIGIDWVVLSDKN